MVRRKTQVSNCQGFWTFQDNRKHNVYLGNKTVFITHTQRNHCSKYGESAPVRNTVLQWVQNFQGQASLKV